MAVIKCDNCGKYYNDGQYSSCQSCGASAEGVGAQSSEETQILDDTSQVTGSTVGLGKYVCSEPSITSEQDLDDEATIALGGEEEEDDPDDQVTIAMVKKDSGMDPVCGWLVCTDGVDKGRDYRIKTERNFIGRGAKMDIMISGDDSVSRDNHASITFDPRTLKFTIATGDGRGLVYLNQNVVETPKVLKAYDLVEIGETKLLFIPFSTEQYSWEKDKEK